MKDLLETTYEFRTTLARKSEPYYVSYYKANALYPSYNKVIQLLSKKQVKSLDKEVWTLLSATSQTIRYDSNACQMSLSKNVYTTANKTTNKSISLTRMKELLTILEDMDLITVYKGYNSMNNERGIFNAMRSTIIFSDRWLSFFDIEVCKVYGKTREFDLVILKDSKGNIVPTKGLRGIGKERNFLKEWNTLLDDTKITIDNERVKPVYTINYKEDFTKGGRLYAGAFSTEAHELRETITLNDKGCCEVDYQNNHFRILYNEIGVDYQTDCYQIAPFPEVDAKEFRTTTKLAGVTILNAKSRIGACRALVAKLKKAHSDKDGFGKPKVPELLTIPATHELANHIYDELVAKHEPISNNFFKGDWGRLQKIDSNMAKQVVKAFIVKGEPVLTYHDSFVCKSEHKDFLINTMKEAWEIVLGDSKGFGYDIEFCK